MPRKRRRTATASGPRSACFNEAGAMPRKRRRVRQEAAKVLTRFNEAGAMPRKRPDGGRTMSFWDRMLQ